MGTFDLPLDLRYVDGRNYELIDPFTYRHALGEIDVPAGFVTDFASIPRALWVVLPPTGGYGKAAVVHDAIYRTPSLPFTRGQADGIFRDAMADLGVGWFTRQTMWLGVRAGGGHSYRTRTTRTQG